MLKYGTMSSIYSLRLTITVLLLVVFSLSATAQDRSQWLTPIADIQFKGDKVVYYYQVSDPTYRLEPLFITSAFTAIPSVRKGSSVANDLSKSRKWLDSEVKFPPSCNDITAKEAYLKACALYIIWNMNHIKLPDNRLEQNITMLTSDSDTSISHDAYLSKKLYTSICEGLKEVRK